MTESNIIVKVDLETIGVPRDKAIKALNRLMCWGLGSDRHAYVTIMPDRDAGDMIAVYRETPESKPSFVLGAVWSKANQSYSFHS